jgi:hypothetical protein
MNNALQLVTGSTGTGADMDHSSHRRQQQQQFEQLQSSPDARFSCSICTDAVIEPVVTHCGHLYCWPCLYRWLEPGMTPQERNGLMGLTSVVSLQSSLSYDPSKRVCPVCRAPCSVKRVIPIYVRTETAVAQQATPFSTSTRSNRFTSIESTTTNSDVHNDDIDYNDDEVMNRSNTIRHSEVAGGRNDRDDQILVETVEDIVDSGTNTGIEENVAIHDDHDGDYGDDGADNDLNEHDLHRTFSEDTTSLPPSLLLHSTGLRHRARVRSSDSETSTPTNSISNTGTNSSSSILIDDVSAVVPRRPIARSSSNLRLAENEDVAAAAVASQQQLSLQHSRLSPTGTTTVGSSHPASLAHGMLPLVQQALRHAAIAAGGSVNDFVPPLHRLEGMNNNQYQSSSSIPSMDQYNDRTSTDFLSWILLLLGIFVLACLILF